MKNMSDGTSNGLALIYIKDGIAYPVALVKNDLEMLDIMIPSIVQKAYPVLDNPIGKVEVVK